MCARAFRGPGPAPGPEACRNLPAVSGSGSGSRPKPRDTAGSVLQYLGLGLKLGISGSRGPYDF